MIEAAAKGIAADEGDAGKKEADLERGGDGGLKAPEGEEEPVGDGRDEETDEDVEEGLEERSSSGLADGQERGGASGGGRVRKGCHRRGPGEGWKGGRETALG